MESLRRTLMRPIDTGRAMAREALALSRNYRHAAALRRQLRSTHRTVVVTTGVTALIGEAFVLMEHAPWTRLVVLTLLLVAAARNR